MTDEEAISIAEGMAISEYFSGGDRIPEALRQAARALRVKGMLVDALEEGLGEMPTCTRERCRCAFCLATAALTEARKTP